MHLARERRHHWRMLFDHRMPEGTKTEQWLQEKIARLFGPLEELLRPYFSVRQDRKRKMAARVLWGSVHGLCFLQETGKIELVGGKADTATGMADYLIDAFIAGINTET